ncbi:MAG: hypothetical protein LBC80_07000 [Treponema sp.]|jgi:hypothetical protein|nr:hypothetical protein [Treponema sp.]
MSNNENEVVDNSIIIDPQSGISVEEQQEILTQINGIAEKNRHRLSQKEQGSGKKAVIKAKKSGAFFPLAVNIAAVLVLAAGSLLLVFFNSMKGVQIRTGTADYDIRLAGVQQETSAELVSAMEELVNLTQEQERINAIDALISGGLIAISSLIQELQFDQATVRVNELRQSLNNNSLAALHAFQSRRTFYNQLLDFAVTLIEDAQRQLDLITFTAQQEDTINDLQTTIGSLEADKAALDQTIITRENTITSLETQRNTLNQTITARDGTITSLETQRDTMNQTLTTRESTITSLRTQNTELEHQVESLHAQIALIRQAAGL